MILRELVLENFGPYRGRQVVDLTPNADEEEVRPIILFGGMNGGGKTTFMDAIRLAFYGQRAQCSTRGNLSYSDFLSQAVNRHSEDKTRIELAFEEILDNQLVVFRITRSWQKGDNKDTLSILVDDWPDRALTNTWDEYIENLLPLGISNLFLFDGEQVKELAELDVPPPQVKEAIQALLGLELAEKLGEDLEVLVNRKRKQLANQTTLKTLEEIESKLNEQKKEYKQAEAEFHQLEADLKKANENYRLASENFISEGGKIASQQSQLERKINELKNDEAREKDALRDLAADVLPLALITPLLEAAKTQGETELEYQQALLTQDVIKQRDRALLDYLHQLAISATEVDKISGFLQEQNQEVEAKLNPERSPYLRPDQDTINLLNTVLDYRLPNQVKDLKIRQEKLQEITSEIDSSDRELANAASPEAYQKLQDAVKAAQEKRAKAQHAWEAGKRHLNALADEIKATQKQLESYSQEAIDQRNNEHIIQSAAKVQKTLEQFKEKLTLKKLNKLEIEVTECFRYLLHKSDLVHRVSIDSQTFRLSLFDPNGKPLPKHRLSAGEKQLLAIAFLWGLARVSHRQLPIAIDTPLGRLDSSHRHNLVERYFPSASHQVILFSTDTEIGQVEYEQLNEQSAIAHQYQLHYDEANGETQVKTGYFDFAQN
ncbi:DNA sulfur modification protein DndD [Halothece sp. PCC 7418]|uniref:DNA sulfur modification protein DndD n=1 Tax=Halothece sp. (strain PCC 7418) TaxID=65093 RepID=UPI0002A075D0|nr:DNA sulfur modification protein DndD [Halothece sp. PCC 7418]AFZ45149.1 DNA sulfur modification protein DndD [Halothece sp. PCC 7418]